MGQSLVEMMDLTGSTLGELLELPRDEFLFTFTAVTERNRRQKREMQRAERGSRGGV